MPLVEVSHYSTHKYSEFCSLAIQTHCDLFPPAQEVSLSLYVVQWDIIPDLCDKSIYIHRQPSWTEKKNKRSKGKCYLINWTKSYINNPLHFQMQKTGPITFLPLSTQGLDYIPPSDTDWDCCTLHCISSVLAVVLAVPLKLNLQTAHAINPSDCSLKNTENTWWKTPTAKLQEYLALAPLSPCVLSYDS